MNPLSQLPIPLLTWYHENARVLPWRADRDPYKVWVSEIMLQQTRVAAVVDYFTRFLAAFPTVEALAEAPEERLLKLWQGLGYYSRARNLYKAARQVVTQFGGHFPPEYEKLRSLAGVGEYTAAAIASISFGLPTPAVDGNLLRVSARLTGEEGDITTPAVKRKLTEQLRAIIPLEEPGRFNQAMMDLGAMVCLPNGAPLCDRCPAAEFCVARFTGRAQILPVRAPKKARRVEERTVFFVFREGKVALRRRPERGLLAKLWEYPNALSPAENALAEWGIVPERMHPGSPGKHIFTHVEWRMRSCLVWTGEEALPEDWVWADREALARDYAVPSAFAPFQPLLDEFLR